MPWRRIIRRQAITFLAMLVWWIPLVVLMTVLHTVTWVTWVFGFAACWAWANVMDRYWEWKDRPK